jgi:pilus assembly protein Flp/PilA
MDLVNFCTAYVRARFGKTERGAALVEYALLLALIAVVCIVALQFLGDSAADKFSKVGDSIAGAGSGA